MIEHSILLLSKAAKRFASLDSRESVSGFLTSASALAVTQKTVPPIWPFTVTLPSVLAYV